MAQLKPMSKLPPEVYVETVRKSGLVDPAQLDTILAGAPKGSDTDSLGRLLEDSGAVTAWQNKKLMEGRHKGFFLGKYKLLRHIGSGGMSSVYLAEHTRLKRLCAIKILPTSRINDSSYLQRFLLEARAIASLDHPNIVRAYDVDNEGNVYFLSMEFIEGVDLERLVKDQGPLAAGEAAGYIKQAAAGLAHAHERGLIHRDIKPSNLFRVGDTGTLKILDMGLARLTKMTNSLTQQFNERVLGTADYLSPEQAINSHDVDHRSDLYSLGCTLYFLLTGRPPFPDGTLAQRLMKHQVSEPVPVEEFRNDVPPVMLKVLATLMAKKPGDRYQNATDLEKVLDEWLTTGKSDVRLAMAAPPKPRPAASETLVGMQHDDTAVTRASSESTVIPSHSANSGSGLGSSSGSGTSRGSGPMRVPGKSTRRLLAQRSQANAKLLIIGAVVLLAFGGIGATLYYFLPKDVTTLITTPGLKNDAGVIRVENSFPNWDTYPIDFTLSDKDAGAFFATLQVLSSVTPTEAQVQIGSETHVVTLPRVVEGEPPQQIDLGVVALPPGEQHAQVLIVSKVVLKKFQMGYRPFLITGPFPLEDPSKFSETKYGPETQPYDRSARFEDGLDVPPKPGWRQMTQPFENSVDLTDTFESKENLIVYLTRTIAPKEDGMVSLTIGRDDMIAVFLDNELVYERDTPGTIDLSKDTFSFPVKTTNSQILLKIGQVDGTYGYHYRHNDQDKGSEEVYKFAVELVPVARTAGT